MEELTVKELESLIRKRFLEGGEVGFLALQHPLWNYWKRIDGFTPELLGEFIGVAGEVSHCKTRSQFWAGMGLGGKPTPYREVKEVGEKIRRKILENNGKLKSLYLSFIQKTNKKSKLHRHKLALRKTQKILYGALWEEWRKIHGFPTTPPYIKKNNWIKLEDLCDSKS